MRRRASSALLGRCSAVARLPVRLLAMAALALPLGAASVLAQTDDLSAYISGDRRSGYTFLTPQTRALQNDDFANPGMLWVEQGRRMWKAPAGPSGQSCATCHMDAAASMRGVAARYPAYDAQSKRVVNLEQRINMCRTQKQGVAAFAYESRDLLAITAFVANQSRGLPVAVKTDGPAAESFARGEGQFYGRIGQLDLACSNCHEDRVGSRLRGDVDQPRPGQRLSDLPPALADARLHPPHVRLVQRGSAGRAVSARLAGLCRP